MAKITTDFEGNEPIAVVYERLSAILTAYGGTPELYTTWAEALADLNAALDGSTLGVIVEGELASSFRPKINFLNDLSLALLFDGDRDGAAHDWSGHAGVGDLTYLFDGARDGGAHDWSSHAGTGDLTYLFDGARDGAAHDFTAHNGGA